MSAADLLTRRIREWVKYPIMSGTCRAKNCKDDGVADTPEGLYCLAHYADLRSCSRCGAAADQYVHDAPICATCQDSDIEMILIHSSLSLHDETPGHDTLSRGDGDFRGFSEKLHKAGFRDISDWSQLRRSKTSP